MRFPREISVSVPNEFIVISNGELQEASTAKEQKKIYTWKETNPDPVYLTSVIVGKFAEIIEHYERQIDLLYYVPVNKRDRAERSFKGTANMIKFFESYFGTYTHTQSMLRLQSKTSKMAEWKILVAQHYLMKCY